MALDLLNGILQGFNQATKDMDEQENRADDKRMKKLEWEAKQKSAEEQKQRQKFADAMNVRESGFQMPQMQEGQNIYDLDPSQLKYDPQYLALHKKNNGGDIPGGKQMSPHDTMSVQEGESVPNILSNIGTTLESNKDIFGPVAGRWAGANPWNTRAGTIDAQLRTASQAFGKFMEGGVLRKEDEDKYRKMFPQLSDTPEIAANKLALVNKQLIDKQNGNIDALAKQGYRTAGFNKRESPALPGILSEGLVSPGLVNTMQAGPDVGSSISAVIGNKQKSNKIKMSNGSETLMVDPRDEAAAAKDGFGRVK